MMALLLFLAFTAISSVIRAWHLRRGYAKSRIVESMQGLRSDAPDGIGVSVLCHAESLAQIERLLASEYARYEVVAVVDSARQRELTEALVVRYNMIEVGHRVTGDLPTEGIRRLMRSRRRWFRRLIIVDFHGTERAGFDAAAEVATYDFVLPLRRGVVLQRRAVERLVGEVASEGAGRVQIVAGITAPRVMLISRAALVRAGGMTRRAWWRVPPRSIRMVVTPLALPSRPPRATPRIAAAAILLAATLAASVSGVWIAAAIAAVATLVSTAATYETVLLMRYNREAMTEE